MFSGRKIILAGALTALIANSAGAAETGAPFGLLTDIAKDRQVALAMSAAPAEIASHATILVLEPAGYVNARDGTNGFTCLVERQLLNTLEPSCYDAEGSATTLKVRLYREELRAAKVPEDEIDRQVEAGYKSGTFKAPARAGFVYMLSPHNQVFNDRTGKIMHVPPHLMFYAPYATAQDFGGFNGPQLPYVVLEGRPDAYIIVAPELMAGSLPQAAGTAEADTSTHSQASETRHRQFA